MYTIQLLCNYACEQLNICTAMSCTFSPFTCVLLPGLIMPSGALLLATGDAQTGALTNNTGEKVSLAQPLGVPGTDDDLKVTSTLSGYDQVLYDQVMLQFDITPTQSGNLAFQYVFGSEEYPENTPACEYIASRICLLCLANLSMFSTT